MFDKVKALCGLIVLGNQQKETSEGTAYGLLKRKFRRLEVELELYKEVGKGRYEQNEPLKARIKALETQNAYLRETSALMRETIEAQTETLKDRSKPSEVRISAAQMDSSSFDSKNS